MYDLLIENNYSILNITTNAIAKSFSWETETKNSYFSFNLFFNEIIGLFFECEVVISKKEIFSGIALMTDSFIANFPAKCS